MKRCTITALIILLGAAAIPAQITTFHRPDFDEIGSIVNSKDKPYYYPKLMDRYLSNDTTLSPDEFYLLYYGYFFQEGYNAFGSASAYNDSVKALYRKDDFSDADRRLLLRYTEQLLSSNPFNLKCVNRMYRLYHDLGDTVMSGKYLFKLEMIAKTLFSTGDGKTDSTGIHVLAINDEYAVLSLLGYEFGGTQSLTSRPCDYLTVKENSDGLSGMYFDVTQLFVGYKKLLAPTLPDEAKPGR